MTWVRRIRLTLDRHVLFVDFVVAAAVGAFTLLVRHPDLVPGQVVPLPAVVAGAVSCLALAGRRRWPRASLTVVILATGAAVALAGHASVWTVANVVGMYTAAVRTDRRTTVRGFLAFTVVFVAAVTLARGVQDTRFLLDTTLGLLGWTTVAAAVGDAVRTRRAWLVAAEERADRAEQTREEEARRRVVEERLRIARELHDVVAHNVAVVSVQAGLADHLFAKQPDAARQALHQVQRASATILDELAGILSVLRHPDEHDLPLSPAPGLGQLDQLIHSYVGAGMDVDVSTAGEPHELGGNADLVAYRVVQEALTNAHKHGGPRARVALTYSPQDVVLDVANPLAARSPRPPGTGHGITGMRERAAAVGGNLQVDGDTGGEFRVRLTLPARQVQS